MCDMGEMTMARTRAEKFSTWGSRGLALVAAVMTGVFLVGIAPSSASPGDRSSASGTFLSGSLVSAIDGALNTSATQNLGTTATQIDRHNLNASVLNGFNIALPGNLGIPVHLTNAGALSSYAKSDPDASSIGASGLVGNDGVIGVGTVPPSQVPGNLTFDLHDILGLSSPASWRMRTSTSAPSARAPRAPRAARRSASTRSPAASCASPATR